MKIRVSLCLLLVLVISSTSVSKAGESGDKLTTCILAAATKEDKRTLVRWLGYSIAKQDIMAIEMRVSEKEFNEAKDAVKALRTRLMGEVCREYTEKAIELEGDQAVQESFKILGQAASFELFADPEVQQNMSQVARYLKKKILSELQGGSKK